MRCRFAAVENNVHISFTQQVYKLEFVEGSELRATLSFRTSPKTGVGISIEFQAAYRHPFVGAVIDRPPGRARTQVVTNLVYNRFCPFNFGMIATGNHQDFDSLRAAPHARYRTIL